MIITTQPASQIICLDGSATFTVVATGTAPVTRMPKVSAEFPDELSKSCGIQMIGWSKLSGGCTFL